MNNVTNLRDTIIAKSDQLNADDLIGINKVITITGVTRGNVENPINVHYQNDDGRPWKPCKTMRRLLIHAWGENGNDWTGQAIELYRDPTVRYAGKEVGGIRIANMTGINKPLTIMLTATRGKKNEYKVGILQPQQKQPYPQDKFDGAFEAMKGQIENGKMTAEQVIAKCEQTGLLSSEQRQKIRECTPDEENNIDDVFKGEE